MDGKSSFQPIEPVSKSVLYQGMTLQLAEELGCEEVLYQGMTLVVPLR
jgi:hypothetical protein